MRLRKSSLALHLAALSLAPLAAHAQFSMLEFGGSLLPDNLASLETSIPFAKDLINNGGYAEHQISHIVDQVYGNSKSWIGGSANSFIGISFGDIPQSIGSFAFGRDNTFQFTDRTGGIYTLQYTTVPNPDASTPEEEWTTIGSINQQGFVFAPGGDLGPYNPSLRKAFSFAPVEATGVRLIVPGENAVDEFEVSGYIAPPLTLEAIGGSMNAALNIALPANGGLAFAKDTILDGTLSPHQVHHLNDGTYGNNNSWIGNSAGSFAGIRFELAQTINRVAFGRDNTDVFEDRIWGYYMLQYTRDENPDQFTPDESWTDIGPLFLGNGEESGWLRHEYAFDPIEGVTGIRLFTPGIGMQMGAAIDELEVYAVPEPGSAGLVLLGGALLGWRRRRAVAAAR